MRTLICVLLVILTGCASKPTAVLPIAATCLGPAPNEPVYLFGDGVFPGDKAAATAALIDLLEAKGYIVALKAQMSGCR